MDVCTHACKCVCMCVRYVFSLHACVHVCSAEMHVCVCVCVCMKVRLMAVSLSNEEGVMVMAAKNTVSRTTGLGSLLASETSEGGSVATISAPTGITAVRGPLPSQNAAAAGAALDVIQSSDHAGIDE